jgi:hypothetical protein
MLVDPAHDCILKNVESISVHDIDHETTGTMVIAHKLAELSFDLLPNPPPYSASSSDIRY